MSTPDTADLPTYYTALHRAAFEASLAAGTARPFVLPHALLGSFVLPVLYLAIPHRRRPWLYHARWAVVAAMAALNVGVVVSGTSSRNFAVAYATGLAAAWGTLWGACLVGVMGVQWTAGRVRVRRGGGERKGMVDESMALMREGDEYYWQAYPEGETFWVRLEWVWDLYCSFRGAGWTFAIPSIPSPPRPLDPHKAEPVDLSNLLITSRSGFYRHLTYRSFFRNRLFHIAWTWLLLDAFTLTARYDPYFVPGPPRASIHPLPPLLSALPPSLLSLLRTVISGAGIITAILCYFNTHQLLTLLLHPRSPTLPLWQHPSIFGSLTPILDRGLAGFWGGFWHQTFRLGFTAPTTSLLPPSLPTTVVTLFTAFLLSGALHAAGSLTAVPANTLPASPILFFLLSFVGVLFQPALCALLRGPLDRVPKAVRRVGNLGFVFLWLHATRWALIDDISRAGIWLYEPVPVSPLRMVLWGLGWEQGGGRWWRWDREWVPGWYWGRYWWESGIRL
ncbi:membrane bound O-acyl transferase family-domain-containing protein [Lasiosphaeria hispida]|uniref:Membrane bound O-acyl transferase family-domain-containing protein n=1 Tax=Lasiosphaeria hispida TaxID=260671 RepID=A0AAJ0H7D6_9PEZI|nr:membrane bound O-acyl transferase family-domain-containing protein [Lasiosphaeria hispida]